MSDPALLFAVLTGVSAAGNAISVRLGASWITPAAGAVVVGAVALTVNLAVLGTLKLRGEPLVVTPRGLAWVLAAGVAVLAIALIAAGIWLLQATGV
jgi:hypothetical protein